jgi:hypothetical protein
MALAENLLSAVLLAHKILVTRNFTRNIFNRFPTEISDQATVQGLQTILDDEPSSIDEDMHVADQCSKKRQVTGSAASDHMGFSEA